MNILCIERLHRKSSLKCGSSKNCVLKAYSQSISVLYEHFLSITIFTKKEG